MYRTALYYYVPTKGMASLSLDLGTIPYYYVPYCTILLFTDERYGELKSRPRRVRLGEGEPAHLRHLVVYTLKVATHIYDHNAVYTMKPSHLRHREKPEGDAVDLLQEGRGEGK